jgi:hypothetical protein
MLMSEVLPTTETRAARSSVEVDIDGRRITVDAADMVDFPVSKLRQMRSSPSWKGKRNYSGFYWAATTRRHHWFESLYEQAALMSVDRDPSGLEISTQPFTLRWGTGRVHTPDICVRLDDARLLVIDVRPRPRIDSRARESFAWTSALCEQIGVTYRLFADTESQEIANLRFLSGYRFSRWNLTERERNHISESHGDVRTIRAWIQEMGSSDRPAAGLVYSALWSGYLDADLTAPLSMRSLALANLNSARERGVTA